MTDHLQETAPPTFSDEDLARLGSIVEWVQQSPDMWHHWPFMVRTRDYVASLRESLAGVQQQQHEGRTEKSATPSASPNQQLEPGLKGEGSEFAIRTIAAEGARLAHYLLGTGIDFMSKQDASRQLAEIARKLNALAPIPFSDEDMQSLLGRAKDSTPRRFRIGVVIHIPTSEATP